MSQKKITTLGIMEAIAGLAGASIICYKFGVMTTLAVFLIQWSLQAHMEGLMIKYK